MKADFSFPYQKPHVTPIGELESLAMKCSLMVKCTLKSSERPRDFANTILLGVFWYRSHWAGSHVPMAKPWEDILLHAHVHGCCGIQQYIPDVRSAWCTCKNGVFRWSSPSGTYGVQSLRGHVIEVLETQRSVGSRHQQNVLNSTSECGAARSPSIVWKNSPRDSHNDYRMKILTLRVFTSSFVANTVVKQKAINSTDKYPQASSVVLE